MLGIQANAHHIVLFFTQVPVAPCDDPLFAPLNGQKRTFAGVLESIDCDVDVALTLLVNLHVVGAHAENDFLPIRSINPDQSRAARCR